MGGREEGREKQHCGLSTFMKISNTILFLYLLSDMNSQAVPSIMNIAFLYNKYMNFQWQRQMFYEDFIPRKSTSLSLPYQPDTWTRAVKNSYFRKWGKGWENGSNPSLLSPVSLGWSSHCYLLPPLDFCCCSLVLCSFLQLSFLIFDSSIPLPTLQNCLNFLPP